MTADGRPDDTRREAWEAQLEVFRRMRTTGRLEAALRRSRLELLGDAEALEQLAASERVAYYRRWAPKESHGFLCDVGCGNGASLRHWRELGFKAVGVDASPYRLGRWLGQRPGGFVVLADARRLPFRENVFAMVVSSGMLEHVGVAETSDPYTVTPLPDKESSRAGAVREMVRVLREEGDLFLDFPNGQFPIDFWHGDRIGAFRWHGRPDTLLPSRRELAQFAADAGAELRCLPLSGRLRFRQIGRRVWGRLLRWPADIFLRLLDALGEIVPRERLAGLYPYLVLRIRRPRSPRN